MKTAVLITTLLCFVVVALGQQQQVLPLPSFPTAFIGSFVRNQSYFGPQGTLTTHTIQFNLPAKRAFVSVVPQSDVSSVESGEFWLIFAPPGAVTGSSQSQNFVLFARRNLTANGKTTSYCTYTTHPDWPTGTLAPPGKFPPHWHVDGKVLMSGWIDFGSDTMTYSGTGIWRNIDVNHWESVRTCSLFGEDPIPCARLATPVDDDNTPAATVIAHQKTPNTFESDWISFDWWTSFEATAPSINLPFGDWTKNCYNRENGFVLAPEHGYVTTPSAMDNFTVVLTSSPIASLGPVNVQLKVERSCTNCIQFQSANGSPLSRLTFDATNWNVPQQVFLKYLKDGEVYFTLTGTGGGYDIPLVSSLKQTGPEIGTRSYSVRALACSNGVAGWGCNNKRRR